jgi:L-rhamnose mutarotase
MFKTAALAGLVLISAGCATTVHRVASVALIPEKNVEKVCAELKASEGVQRGGLYLREIEGETYLFQYLEFASRDGHKNFQPLEPYCIGAHRNFQTLENEVEPLPEAARKDLVFEPMERIFYEAGAADKEPKGDVKRIAMFTELKRDKEAYYRLLHDNPWPDVVAAIHKANFRHFSIFLEEINGRVYLFGWLEYVGADLAADGAENKKDPASIRWWKETDACQIAPEDAGDGMWGGMEELLFVK